MLRYLFIFVYLFFSGCTSVEYHDISNRDKYQEIVGKRYQTLVDLEIHGVTLENNYKQQIDIYSVTMKPGFSGPEVITKKTLEKKTIFKINQVIECSKCFFQNRKFIIEILTSDDYQKVPIRLHVDGVDAAMIVEKNNKVKMNSKFFRALEATKPPTM